MTTRIGVQHEPAFKDERFDFSAHEVVRLECPDVPVLGQVRAEMGKLPTDLAQLNRDLARMFAEAMAAGFDYGVMAARANPKAAFIDPRHERMLETLHSSDPEKHAEHVARSAKSWAADRERAPVDWVGVDEKTGQLRVQKMRTYTDFNAWKTACRERGWTGPHVVTGDGTIAPPHNHQFVGPDGTEALWNSTKNEGYIFSESPPTTV